MCNNLDLAFFVSWIDENDCMRTIKYLQYIGMKKNLKGVVVKIFQYVTGYRKYFDMAVAFERIDITGMNARSVDMLKRRPQRKIASVSYCIYEEEVPEPFGE